MRLAFDLESNGLLHQFTKILCLTAKDIDTGKVYEFGPDQIDEAVVLLKGADLLIGHNIIGFDIPAIQKLYPEFDPCNTFDTLVAARLIYSNIKDHDALLMQKYRDSRGAVGLPPKMYGRQSLESWGYRLGDYKGDFKPDDWTAVEFSQEMMEYCVQDIEVTTKLYRKLAKKVTEEDKLSLELEHRVQRFVSKIEQNGFPFNEKKGAELYSVLVGERNQLQQELVDLFGYVVCAKPAKTPKKTIRYKEVLKADRTAGAKYTPIELKLFNPGSRTHIAKVFKRQYQWKPAKFTENGAPQIDETVLEALPYPEAQPLARLFYLNKQIGMLAEGDNAWLKLVRNGRIHGGYNANGAGTGRSTHNTPNIAQVPKEPRFRELFGTHLQVGVDASGLELRCLAHYLGRYDRGSYVKTVTDGDVHTANQKAAGLPDRNSAKTFIYATLYGAGPQKIGSITKPDAAVNTQKKEGLRLRKNFERGLPGFKALTDAVKERAGAAKKLRGLDGRNIHIRSPHSALNFLLQGAGAAICKLWMVELNDYLESQGLTHSWDGDYAAMAWVHDELQFWAKDESVAQKITEASNAALRRVEEVYKLRCPLDGDVLTGANWSECH